MAKSTGKKRKLPRDVSKLKGDEVLRKVFNKKVVNELKKVAHEGEEEEPRSE